MQKVPRDLIAQLKAGTLKPMPAAQTADDKKLEPEEQKKIEDHIEKEVSESAKKSGDRPLPLYIERAEPGKKALVVRFDKLRQEDPVLVSIYGAQPPELRSNSIDLKRFITAPAEDSLDVDTDEAKRWRGSIDEELMLGLFLPIYVGTPVLFMLLQGIIPSKEEVAEYQDLCAKTAKNQKMPEFKPKNLDSQWPSFYMSSNFLLLYYRACQRHLLGQIDSRVGVSPEGKQKDELITAMTRMRESAKKMAKELVTRRRKANYIAIRDLFATYRADMPYGVQRSRTTVQWVKEHRETLVVLARELRLLTVLELRFTEACVCQLLFGNTRGKEDLGLLRVPDDGTVLPTDLPDLEKSREQTAALHLDQLVRIGKTWRDTDPKYPSGAPAFAHREGCFLLQELLGTSGTDAKMPENLSGNPVYQDLLECFAPELGDGTTNLGFLWWRMCIAVRELRAQKDIEREKELAKSAAYEDPHPLQPPAAPPAKPAEAPCPIHSTASS